MKSLCGTLRALTSAVSALFFIYKFSGIVKKCTVVVDVRLKDLTAEDAEKKHAEYAESLDEKSLRNSAGIHSAPSALICIYKFSGIVKKCTVVVGVRLKDLTAEDAEKDTQNTLSRSMKSLCGTLRVFTQRPLRFFAFTIFGDRKKVHSRSGRASQRFNRGGRGKKTRRIR